MSFIKTDALKAIRGSALFYPSAGRDWDEPLRLFVPCVHEYWFVDTTYFTHDERGDRGEPSISGHADLVFERFELSGSALAALETRRDESSGCEYPFVEPCTRSEVYRHRPSDTRVVLHRRRGFGQRSIAMAPDMGVFFHRGDSPGEAGSNVHWLSGRWIHEVMSRLRDGGLVVTDGSLAHPRPLRRFHGREVPSEAAFEQAKPFTKWGRRWECVGWADRRYGPTLIWRTTAA